MSSKADNAELGRMKLDAKARRASAHAAETGRVRTCAQCQGVIPAGARGYTHPGTHKSEGDLGPGKMAGATICYDCDSKLRAIADLLSEAESSKPESAAAVPYWRQSLAEQVRPYWMRDSDEEDEDE